MKIVIIGGTGLVGSKLVSKLRHDGNEVVAASPHSGVDSVTGEGLAEALTGAQVVVDVANSPSFEDRAVLEFFEKSGRNLLAAEFLGGIAQSATTGQTVRLSPALLQPIASDDVVAALAEITVGTPANGTIEIAGPDRLSLDALVRRFLSASKDTRQVVADVHARYFGAELDDRSLTPGNKARVGRTGFEDWLSHFIPTSVAAKHA
jgi:uncharacterized protein YbjT (DUF2867 family)